MTSDNNGGHSDFSDFDETDFPKKADVVSSKQQSKSKNASSKTKITRKISLRKLRFRQNRKINKTSGSTSASSAAIKDTPNLSSESTSAQTASTNNTKKNAATKGKSAQNASKGKTYVRRIKIDLLIFLTCRKMTFQRYEIYLALQTNQIIPVPWKTRSISIYLPTVLKIFPKST